MQSKINANKKISDSDVEKGLIRFKSNEEHFKGLSQLNKEVRKNAKLTYCYYCKKKCDGFCNSHSTPEFILRNIAEKGKLFDSVLMLGDKAKNYSDLGLNKSGTFHLICRECDSKNFSNYENPKMWGNKPNDTMMCEIAIKNYLYRIAQLRFNIKLFRLIEGLSDKEIEELKLDELRLKRYDESVDLIKNGSEFEIIYFNRLDYIVPIAVQDSISLMYDLNCETINVLNEDLENLELEDIHICIFPMATESIILMFKNKNDKKLDSFVEQFNKLRKKVKLDVLNYIIFTYSDRYLLSKKLDITIIEELKKVTNCSVEDSHNIMNFSKIKDIPNILLDMECKKM